MLWAIIVAFITAAGLASSAQAAAPAAPALHVTALGQPTNFSSGRNAECDLAIEVHGPLFDGHEGEPEIYAHKCNRYLITVRNFGAVATDGSTITISDALPAGFTTVGIGNGFGERRFEEGPIPMPPLSCTLSTTSCTYSGVLGPGEALAMIVLVDVDGSKTGQTLTNDVTVEGGNSAAAATAVNTDVTSERPPFGVEAFELEPLGPDGATATQAGSHLETLTTRINLSTELFSRGEGTRNFLAIEDPKVLAVNLPLGLVGNPQATPQCPEYLVLNDQCPANTRVGSIGLEIEEGRTPLEGLPLFNVAPQAGYAAEFATEYAHRDVFLYAEAIHTAGGYRLRVSTPGIPHISGVLRLTGFALSFFGNPASKNGGGGPSSPFFSSPVDCSAGPLYATAWADSWPQPGRIVSTDTPVYPGGVTGCAGLEFAPTISSRPTNASADSPTSLDFDLAVPQDEDLEGLATPPVRDIAVAFPTGLAVSPSSADGLQSCQAEGPEGINIGSSNITVDGRDLGDPFASELGAGHPGGNQSSYDDGLWHSAAGHCPAASQIGSVEVTTPLLDHPLPGHVYLGSPECAPCTNADAASGRLLKLYLEINDPKSGVIVKLPGLVKADPTSGQLTAVFQQAPQLPFSDVKVRLKEGSRAPLRTPTTCGTYTTATNLTPWSAPETSSATPSDSFAISSVPGSGGCPTTESQLPNTQAFEAGTVTPTAGTYSRFVLNLERADGTQQMSSIETTLPEGLLGRLAGISYCSDMAIAVAAGRGGALETSDPSCPLASEVGTVKVGAGPGPTPYYVSGHVYLAGPYKGAPLSLAIVTPAVAGPFDLGDVVVRTALNVDPFTAQIHAVSDQIPQILDGIPLDVRSIALSLARPNFTLNPTSCDPMAILGASSSTVGSTNLLYQRFQVGSCGKLGFKPKLTVSLKGATKRNGHPALKAVVTYPKKGTYANIAKAQVGLPHSEFLDQSHIRTVCTQPQLKADACPRKSIYGHAKAWTPLLDKPLEGPVYLGVGFGHKLPDLVADLNGQIRILLHGRVDTDKQAGIRNTFETVPDAPVSRFVLEMKGGKKGLIVNSTNICKGTHEAEVAFRAQNGEAMSYKAKIANSCKSERPKHKKKRGA
jgi:hypothetical protein